jgi:hypothetical protein
VHSVPDAAPHLGGPLFCIRSAWEHACATSRLPVRLCLKDERMCFSGRTVRLGFLVVHE